MPRTERNDGPILANVQALKAADPSLSDRQAITRSVPSEKDIRRVQGRIKREKGRRHEAIKAEVAATHADRHPVTRATTAGVTKLTASVPFPGGGVASIDVKIDIGSGGRSPGGITCGVVWHGHGPSPWPGQCGALDALGLGMVDEDGVLCLPRGPAPAAQASAGSLRDAWIAAGVPSSRTLSDEALGVETERYADLAIPALASRWDVDAAFVAATCGDLALVAVAAPLGLDPARRMLLRSLGTLAGAAVASLPHEEARGWSSRPVECLVALNGPRSALASRLGRPLALADAAWLDRTIGRWDLAPVPARAQATLLRFRGCIDPSRVANARDAAGLVAMMDAVDAIADGDARLADGVLDLLADRLDKGGDGRGYAEVVADLRAMTVASAGLVGRRVASLPGIAPALAAATVGVERLRESVALSLLVPTMALSGVGRGDPDTCERVAAAVADRVAVHSRDMVVADRGIVSLASVALSFDLREDAPDDVGAYRVPVASVLATLCDWSVEGVDDSPLSDAWATLSRWLVPRWRMDGRPLYADRVRDLGIMGETGRGPGRIGAAVRRGLARFAGPSLTASALERIAPARGR